MSAAMDSIDANLRRILARLMIMRWGSEERKASLECVARMGRGDRRGSRAAEVWADICSLRAQAWQEEANRT